MPPPEIFGFRFALNISAKLLPNTKHLEAWAVALLVRTGWRSFAIRSELISNHGKAPLQVTPMQITA